MKPASFFQRLVAYLADMLVLMVVYTLTSLLLGLSEEHQLQLGLLSTFASTAYFTYFHSTSGATPGKNLMQLRVLSINGNVPTLLQALLRYSPYIVFSALSILLPIHPDMLEGGDAASGASTAVRLFGMLYLLWMGVSCWMIWARDDRRTLHDHIAYTAVWHTPEPDKRV